MTLGWSGSWRNNAMQRVNSPFYSVSSKIENDRKYFWPRPRFRRIEEEAACSKVIRDIPSMSIYLWNVTLTKPEIQKEEEDEEEEERRERERKEALLKKQQLPTSTGRQRSFCEKRFLFTWTGSGKRGK